MVSSEENVGSGASSGRPHFSPRSERGCLPHRQSTREDDETFTSFAYAEDMEST
jgi:hypothetical protein